MKRAVTIFGMSALTGSPGEQMNTDLNMESLVAEYKATLARMNAFDGSSAAAKRITLALSEQHEWSHAAAATLVKLARDYGTFMLRNALALAVALEIEDGALGH